jgi:hypothetical protein
VPAKIVQVGDIPRTKNGKIVELAVKAVVHDMPVTNTDALLNPEALELFRKVMLASASVPVPASVTAPSGAIVESGSPLSSGGGIVPASPSPATWAPEPPHAASTRSHAARWTLREAIRTPGF